MTHKAERYENKEHIEVRFSEILKYLLKEHGLTQKDLAAYLGLKPQTVSLYCMGKSYPEFTTLIKIAAYFNVSIDYLITGQKEEHKEISTELGLTSNAIDMLKKAQQHDFVLPAVNRLLSDNSFYHSIQMALNRLSIIRAFFKKIASHEDEFVAMLLKNLKGNEIETQSTETLAAYLALRVQQGHFEYAENYMSHMLDILMTPEDKQMMKKVDDMITEVEREIENGHVWNNTAVCDFHSDA